ncbi:hypothetical protein N7499_006983 [Penicillium canescens]|nr:hypothetical protein N7522_008359 [Penicillium canescens]KAJ6082109.1 hypothetical protein N7499_006983 [Penicillium canescens]KAJ6176094.1 hypothetical protein N7485_003008 [Penicillium canescens]
MSSQPHAILPKEAIRSILHMLLIAPNTTRASEVQDIKYIDDVSQWPNIEKILQSSDLREEEVYVADETGVQVHFSQAIGQVLGATLRATKVDIRFGTTSQLVPVTAKSQI